ncbi:MAG: hypothetical protein NXY57DRAFT_1010939 [Lentinula lateritia]|uniref:Extracellular membrane protein CFEM domain-containing protein n=1 Tax=Lentinula lateritia TaxID=40482 RepID=A0ABQ8VEK9_9AGAR|nr:MAG: hypothetical protein NXY57DRAFT_1010939 [Lentinula lateritia]KAJ4491717.1 hypothetical protein C8R41DRAFT_833835 [Lentinula lateritia]
MLNRTFFLFCGLASFGHIATGLPKDGPLELLNSRQTDPNIPTQCQSICDPIVSLIDTGCTPQECCTNVFVGNLTDCFECVGNITQTTNYSLPQSDIDGLVEDCASEGLNITDPTLPGQNPNRTLTTLVPSSTPNVSSSSSFHQSTITTISLATPTFTQNTITSLSSLSTSSSVPTSSTTSVSASTSGAPTRYGFCWIVTICSLCVTWALLVFSA